ncbi:hypothetical protein [Paraburkholderia kururiensis]|uniref:hypothetical protein n=1 Tax=Paraburkholderia kururiensis TaxID=984307 RepID=UPI000346725E|nr:hypothetical protein [Paraburkholderia kururiensis]
MWKTITKFFKDCMTEQDGQSYCPFRIAGCGLSATSIPTFIGLTIWSVMKGNQAWDMKSFAIAFGGMMTGISVLAGTVAFKVKTENAGAPQ